MNQQQSKLVRLQKYIADAGITSRRKAEEMILDGRVHVNGTMVRELGTKVDKVLDTVMVDGDPIDCNAVEKIYLILNKPRACMTTLDDPEGRRTVMELVQDVTERIYPIGRLDYLSEGLLLMTNDGDLANRIIHPSGNITKVYEVKIFGAVTSDILKNLRRGVDTEVGFIKPKSVRIIKQLPTKTWLEFKLTDGKNREIRRLCEAFGLTIDKLKRLAIGGLTVEGIKPGGYRVMTKKQLMTSVGLNDDYSVNEEVEYRSTKKSVSLRMKGVQNCTAANDPAFSKFRKETYFQTLTELKERKEEEARKAKEEFFKEKEHKHQMRQLKKKKRLDKKKHEKENVHAQIVKW